MASPTQWTWVWVDSGSWWWTGRPGLVWFMGSQRVRHDWATELNWYTVVYRLPNLWIINILSSKRKIETQDFHSYAISSGACFIYVFFTWLWEQHSLYFPISQATLLTLVVPLFPFLCSLIIILWWSCGFTYYLYAEKHQICILI